MEVHKYNMKIVPEVPPSVKEFRLTMLKNFAAGLRAATIAAKQNCHPNAHPDV
ncbi:hypothetical protein FD37_GL000622 [Levilactobacillus spicheri DSM 15429]|uniref:Uncharacterized protein n=1 Tax=Levilactobacillus spicheri DSM 15429 TaxID=1423805 RepID=A0A0R1QNT6_9LACO|nr:hypothetical protein FD37_GL000622 [Levilactobacillus spicheri DSM 15429]